MRQDPMASHRVTGHQERIATTSSALSRSVKSPKPPHRHEWREWTTVGVSANVRTCQTCLAIEGADA